MLGRLFDLDHPFFRPPWVRVLVVVPCLAWAAFEFVSGSPFWGVLFGAIGLYCGWHFLFNFHPRPPEGQPPEDP